jgi:hypothetical protein
MPSLTDKVVETEQGAAELCHGISLNANLLLARDEMLTLVTLHDDSHSRANASIDQLQGHQLGSHFV